MLIRLSLKLLKDSKEVTKIHLRNLETLANKLRPTKMHICPTRKISEGFFKISKSSIWLITYRFINLKFKKKKMSDQIDSGQIPRKVKVVAKDFAAKYSNKPECFHFLTHDCGAYLSSYDTMTIWHMRDLANGSRSRIRGTAVKHLNVP